MNKSWDHAAHALDEATRKQQAEWGCSRPRCSEPPVIAVSYRYVTGRAGRTTRRTQVLCKPHGDAFVEKHGVEVGPEAPLYGAPTEAGGPR